MEKFVYDRVRVGIIDLIAVKNEDLLLKIHCFQTEQLEIKDT